jgi:hypothetical protein
MVTAYLTGEQALGRVAATADISTLSPTLVGSLHLLFTDRESGSPDAEVLHKVVETVMQGVIKDIRYAPRRRASRESGRQ